MLCGPVRTIYLLDGVVRMLVDVIYNNHMAS
jgi:hypothetical protein